MKKLLFLLCLIPSLLRSQTTVYGLVIKQVGDSVIAVPAKTTPAPPVLFADDVANTISASSPLGLSEILVSINNGSFGQYTGPLTVGTGYIPAGYYVFKIKSNTTRNESATVSSPTFTADPPATVAQVLQSFTLINASNNTDIQSIVSNSTFNLATLPTRNLNIRANTNPSLVGSVVFSLTGASTKSQTETAAPYALFGDNNGVFLAWTPTTGSYTLTATPYTANSGTGTAGTPLTVNFRVIDSSTQVVNTTPPAPNVTADDQLNTLSASTPLGVNELLVSENNTPFNSYTGQINVGDVNRPLGYWLFKTRAAAGRNESPIASSPVFNAIATTNPNAGATIVTIRATYTNTPTSPTATFTDLGNNKKMGFILTKDDGNVGDYNIIRPLINGGTSPTNGKTYPGFTYSDGAGGTRKWGYTFAINGRGNTLKDGSNTTVTSWAQYKDMLTSNNFALANHSADHANTPTALYQLQLNDTIINRQLGYRMRSIVLPAGLPGFVQGGITMGWPNIWSSEGYGGPNNPSADGYDTEVSWGETFDATTLASQPTRHMIGSRFNFDGLYNDANRGFRNWVDGKFTQSAGTTNKQVYTAFSHGPELGWEADSLNSMLKYIQNHPSNKGDVWFPNLQQFGEYLETKRLAVKSAPSVSGNIVTYTIDLSGLNSLARYKDMSLLLSTGGTLANVEVAGADSYDFNLQTGLVNIYKGGQVTGTTTSPTTLPAPGTGTGTGGGTGGGVTPTPPTPTPDPNTVGMVYGEIPWKPFKGVVMDYNMQDFAALQDGSFDNTTLSDTKLINTPDIVIGFDSSIHATIKEIWFGDGQHAHAAGSPMHSWFYDTATYAKITGPDFTGNLNYAYDKQILPNPVRSDYYVMQQTYPIPTELKFFGWYRPTPASTYPLTPTIIDKQLGAVTYLWDFLKGSGQGIDMTKLNLADTTANLFRIYDDIYNMQKDGSTSGPSSANGQALFSPQNGAWMADDMLDSLKRRGKQVLFCLKGREGMPDYVEMCKQITIRYGRNANVPDNQLNVYTGPGYPANVVKKGLDLVKIIQLGNEPNRWWRWVNGTPLFDSVKNVEGMMTPFQLAAQWKKCYDAIKAIDPTMIVITPGLATNNPAYFEGAMLWSKMFNGGRKIFDGVAYHDYNNTESGQNQTGGIAPGVWPEAAGMTKRAKDMKQAVWEFAPDANNPMPTYITETGYSISTANPSQTPPQAGIGSKDIYHVAGDWTIRSVFSSLLAGLDGTAFYQLYDDQNYRGNYGGYMNWDLSCGLATESFPTGGTYSMRPSARYMQQTTSVMRGYHLESAFMTTDSIFVNKMVKPGSPNVWALYYGTAKGKTGSYQLTLPNVHQVEVNVLNDSQTIPNKSTVNVSGSYIVSVSETPIYIKELN